MNTPQPKAADQAALADALRSDASALLVIDMQNDFCAPGGYIDAVMGKDVAAAAGICKNLQQLLAAARDNHVPVFWIGADYSHDRIPASMLRKLRLRGITATCCEPGSWGAQWFCVSPAQDEAVFIKHNYSGFSGTDLESALRAHGVETLVLTGVQTQICVESTAREGHSLGFTCVVPRDAVASHTPQLHEASLMNVQFLFGEVCTTQDVVSAWAALPSPASSN
ncbi:MAG TPA: isochorismatase family cysteine hydrolase [Pusillimonas sp.]|uniref:cysteine hydrolase family protein n=1 Tax=Pusillimonas sp. TaxID=3040095 RepID=UPI002B838489|nr:isochorismatase family cysteine hydrolase [Pusillimonas sp.]HUH87835.1 isochorismatase family cysteine hydrolase [Pusillimonas sp.]